MNSFFVTKIPMGKKSVPRKENIMERNIGVVMIIMVIMVITSAHVHMVLIIESKRARKKPTKKGASFLD